MKTENRPADVFSAKEGELVVHGGRAHLFYVGADGKATTDWTQPENWDPATSLKGMPGRKLGEGTIAIQGHDPKSVAYYKDIFLRPLP